MDGIVQVKGGFVPEVQVAGDALKQAMHEIQQILADGLDGDHFSVEFEEWVPDADGYVEEMPQIRPFQGDNFPRRLEKNTLGYFVRLYLNNYDGILGDMNVTATCVIMDRSQGVCGIRLDSKGPLQPGTKTVYLPNDCRRENVLKNFLQHLRYEAKRACPPRPPAPSPV